MDGFRNGLISAGLNYAAHYVYNTVQGTITITKMLINASIEVTGVPTYTEKYINDMINKIPLLQEWYERAGKPDVHWSQDSGYEGNYDFVLKHDILIAKIWNTTNYRLLSNLFHEIFHAYQDVSGLYSIAVKTQVNPRAFLEIQAYSFQIGFGDNSVQAHFDKYFKSYNALNSN